jgi:hypothetical protein
VGTRDLWPAEKGRKKKPPGINPGQPAEKRRGKKKTLVLTAYITNPLEKGKKKKKKPWY